MKEIHRQIKAIRKSKGLTQDELADVLGMKKANLSRIESGAVNLKPEKLKIFADYFKMSLEEIASFESAQDKIKKEKQPVDLEAALLEKEKQIERMQLAVESFLAFALKQFEDIIEGKAANPFNDDRLPKTPLEAVSELSGMVFILNSENVRPEFPLTESFRDAVHKSIAKSIGAMVDKVLTGIKNGPQPLEDDDDEIVTY
ncbi:helix-turn-helix domain-containing protein [Adhaeribacter soli]|uniref:Helix-turn-helix transcriptional regulator n=1 Tax=Adhaeribacter soli TaxID=2607655 RepID=A0A5N1IHA5_9BACT|nr:helix-turn-helix transcriptional regulator [Adhaeribacter soli]KAA9325043.1 helix-turn-helix transcriptional regulator [Adhaeribacter soli]